LIVTPDTRGGRKSAPSPKFPAELARNRHPVATYTDTAMNVFADWSWLLAALGVIVADSVFVFIAWRALFSDKSKGRRRCPRCWYDLSYSPGMSCAECGFAAAHEKQLYCTRRRYGAAILAIILAAGVSLFATYHTTQQGVAGMVPTRVLLWSLPVLSPDGDLYAELMRRTRSGAFTDDQWNALFERCATGDWRTKPATEAWIEKYGDVISTWRRILAGDSTVNAALSGIDPKVDVETREVWPVDTPLVALLTLQDWWPIGTECRVTVTPEVGDRTPIVIQRAASDRGQFAAIPITLPGLPADTTAITLDIQVERRPPGQPANRVGVSQPGERPWQVALRESVTLTTRIEGDLAQSLTPVNDEPLLDALRQVFARGIVRWTGGGRSPVRFSIDQPHTFNAAFNDISLGIKVELLLDGEVARQLNLWWLAGDPPANQPATPGQPFDRHYGFEIAKERPELLRVANEVDGRWRLRITGDRSLALRTGTGTKFWDGEFTLPLRIQVRSDEAPQRAWWLVDELQVE